MSKDSIELCHLHKTLQHHRNFVLHIPDSCDVSDHCTACLGHTYLGSEENIK